MEETTSRSNRKRQFFEDDDSNKPPRQKKVRFPKGKKVKAGEEAGSRIDVEDAPLSDLKNPRLAAKERAKIRKQFTTELFTEESGGILSDISGAEVAYEDYENIVDDGIQIEPFNLNKEREEGYFDEAGNFVEYVNDKEIKDAWLDNVEVDGKYVGKAAMDSKSEDNNGVSAKDLSSEDVGAIKRRIANVLEPGETVLQALRRLKGTSNNRKEKMSAETKQVFDLLTDDAMRLMENGDYNVYHEKQEVFEREAEGYERLALARGKTLSATAGQENGNARVEFDIFSDVADPEAASSALPGSAVGPDSNPSVAEVSSSGADAYDMFVDDDKNPKPSSEPTSNAVPQSSSDAVNSVSGTGDSQNDYVYDESSGYYYSSSLAYYYDPSTGLYCSAASQQWYSFNEDTGTYEEVQAAAPSTN